MNLRAKNIAIDAGHGGSDPGAMGKLHSEAYYNCRVAEQLRLHLLEAGASPFTLRWDPRHSRIAIEKKMALSTRANKINAFRSGKAKIHLVLSIHHNADDSGKGKGSETLYVSETGMIVARFVQGALVANLGTADRGVKHRDDLTMLVKTHPVAVLTEGWFVSNRVDEQSQGRVAAMWDLEAKSIVAGLQECPDVL